MEIKPAASTGLSLLESFRFAQFVMGIEIGQDVLADPQILGRVKILGVQRSELDQARPLLCSEVSMLERFMDSSRSAGDLYVLGCCLFCNLLTFSMVGREVHAQDFS